MILFMLFMGAVSANTNPVGESLAIDNQISSGCSFDDLQNVIDNASDDSVICLDNDYNGCENSKIVLNKNLTIDGQGHTIDCSNKKNCFVFYSESGNITLKNLIISNSRNYYSEIGGAIYITGSAVYNIENCTFMKNWADIRGGAIFNNGTNPLSISNSKFINNKVFDDCGGAIYSKNIVNIEGCVFNSNSAVSNGGAICCENDVNIIGCLFENNYCENLDSCGGAINAKGAVRVNNSNFKNNRALKNGGAVQSNQIKIDSYSSFEDNQAANGNGGAIYVILSSNIKNSSFINNKALKNGGAIYSESKLNINNSSFKSNSVEVMGGAVYSEVLLNVEYCEFELNKVSSLFKESYGGAIFAFSVNCSFSKFMDNYAKKAGAIYATLLWADNSIFKNNHANNYGGAIHSITAVLFSSDFVGNTADYGGVIYSNSTLINCSSFENNTAIIGGAVDSPCVFVSASYFNKNFADYGGAVFANKSDETFNSKCEFEYTLFINNVGTHGGAFYVNLKVQSKFSNCNFTNNTSFSDGGAVYMQCNNEASFSQCIFTNNTALDKCGGAIYNQYAKLAKNLGVFDDSNRLYVENCTFERNHAKESGGAIFWTGKLILNPFTYFDSNVADTGSGGAIYTEFFDSVILNCTFINNKAGNVGGAINVNRLTKDIKFSKFIVNCAGNVGGAIYILDIYCYSVSILFSTFIHNKHNTVSNYYHDNVAIFVENDQYPDPNYGKNKVQDYLEGKTGYKNGMITLNDDNVFFYNIAYSRKFVFNSRIIDERGYTSDVFFPNYIKMSLKSNDNVLVDDAPINLTFYLYNGVNGKLYDGDSFDMNNASFDIDPSIKVLNKELGKSSVTLELIPQIGSYYINVNFYGRSLLARLNVSPSIGAFPLIKLEILNIS